MKPVLILDSHWRRVDELFDANTLLALRKTFDVVWALDSPIPDDLGPFRIQSITRPARLAGLRFCLARQGFRTPLRKWRLL
jgi:hypothetical protein